jgi:hypothetical protein
LTEHGRSTAKNLKKESASPKCTLLWQETTHASLGEGKKQRTVNFEKWQPSVSSSLTVTSGAIPQWTEDIPSYWWDSDGN